MKKRLIAFMLIAALVASFVPVSVFAEEDTPVTPSQVADKLDEAQRAEALAGAEAIAMGQPGAAADQALAIANQGFAAGNLAEAVGLAGIANVAKDYAQDCAEDAEAAAGQADGQHEVAHEAADTAEAELENAKNAGNKTSAVNAADSAEAAAATAANAAAEAAVQAEAAQNEADAAYAAYLAAQATYEAALENLEQGGAQAAAAQAAADAAAAEAQAKYEEYVAAAEAAHAATEKAQAEAEKSRQELSDAMGDLEKAIADNAAEVAKDTAIVAATDLALGASKIAVAVAEGTVDYYEGQIEQQEKKKAELEEAIKLADEAIANAKAELDALDETDAAYPQAKAALEAAENAKAAAQNVYDNLGAIMEAKENFTEAENMAQLQQKVASGEATPQDKKDLTKTVLENINKFNENVNFGEIEWVDDEIFSVDDGEGNKSYYKMETVESEDGNYIQYFKAEESYTQDIDAIEKNAKEYAPSRGGYADTEYQAVEGEDKLDVKAHRTVLGAYVYTVNGNELKQDAEGNYYYETGLLNKTKHPVTLVEKLDDPIYVAEETPISTTSNAITEILDAAEDAEGNYNEAVGNYNAAKADYDEAEAAYNAAQTSLNGIIAANENHQELTQKEIDKINDNLKDLDKKLNGGLSDQLIRAIVTGDVGAGISAGAEAARLELKKLFGTATDEELAKLEELSSGLETGKEIAEIIAGVSDGIDLNDISSIVNLIANTSLSAETRLAIAELVEGGLESIHDKAMKDLEEAVQKAEEEVAAAAEAAAQAAANAAQKEVAVAQAMAAEAAANLAKDIAEAYKNQAEEAAKKAAEAKEAYEKLLQQAEDSTLVEEAKQAADDAQDAADAAAEAAEKAAIDAERAAKAAEEAREIADNFPTAASSRMTAAEYAMFLLENPEVFANAMEKANMEANNKNFVRYVYAYVGTPVHLGDGTAAAANKNGYCIHISAVLDSDMFIQFTDGTNVDTYGVCVEKTYVAYDEAASTVARVDLPKDGNICSAVRVA